MISISLLFPILVFTTGLLGGLAMGFPAMLARVRLSAKVKDLEGKLKAAEAAQAEIKSAEHETAQAVTNWANACRAARQQLSEIEGKLSLIRSSIESKGEFLPCKKDAA